jgi:diguanylate cyclase
MERAMSLDDRTAEDAAKWKQKYLDALERQEIAQQTREERLTLLRRGITRVSAAAYGLDPELDQQLDQLRESVRQQGADVQLAAVLEDVEASVLRLDSRKSQGAEIVLEIVLLMPDTDLDQARHVVEKLRRAVEACRFHYQAAQVPITLSFGVAQFSEADSAESLFARADRALYQAKSEGRNRFCMGAAEA